MGSSRLSRYTSSGSRPVATFRRRFSRAMSDLSRVADFSEAKARVEQRKRA